MRLALAIATMLLAAPAWAGTYYVTVAGLGGEPDYEQRFTATAKDLDRTFKASAGAHVYTLTGAQATRAKLSETMAQIAREARPGRRLRAHAHRAWFLRRRRVQVQPCRAGCERRELAAMCDKIPARRQLIVNTSSASGGSVAALERSGRAVIAATKNGTEKNATVFARYWSEALQDPTSDTDKSDSISRSKR